MSQINHIKDLSSCGYRISEISEKTGSDPKTIRKYLSQDDFSPVPPIAQENPSKLDPFKPVIQEWLEEDKKHWRKQHHTAQRIYERLTEEHSYTGSYSIVQRYLKKCRSQRVEKANLELVWDPGPAQVDFGEADFYEAGTLIRKKYLTVSFPYSNDGYSQVFGGETAECVCQGLQDIFEFIGGVPPLLVFDNAAGVGRRVGDAIHESELFSRFRAHYHFRVRFCNPYSGWEKGNVERKVDFNRANLFVPVPHFSEIEKFNEKLLLRHKKKAGELHYKKQVPIRELFEEDRRAFLLLPPKRFNVCRYEWLKADGYGKVCMDGKHFYSTRPENAGQKVLVGIHAHTVEILSDSGQIITTHRRAFGEGRTDISDYSTTLSVLLKNSGAWENSGLRRETPDSLRTYMDAQPKEKLKDCLRIMNELTGQYGFKAAVTAMEMASSRGNINICDASVLAARITGYGIYTPPETGPSLAAYDEAFLKKGGSVS
jgi:transposase